MVSIPPMQVAIERIAKVVVDMERQGFQLGKQPEEELLNLAQSLRLV